ncbi:hypothetical protein [Sedimentitalea xiamensis]|nr:hypothetical protein [Sedimentitalea xiamensis]
MLLQPKSGTTALEAALRNHAQFQVGGTPRWKHLNYCEFKEIFGDYFERQGCEIFGVMRDPIDTMISWYRFRARDELLETRPQMSTKDRTFDEFVTGWSEKKGPAFSHYRRPSEFYRAADGSVAPITYYRYESLPALVDVLSEKIGKTLKLPVKNQSPPMEIEYDWDRLRAIPKMQAEYDFYNALPLR